MKIGLDFDRVLFDTDSFKEFLFDEIDNFDETYQEAKEEFYDPEKHAEILGIPQDRIYNVLSQADKFLYSDIKKLENFEADVEFIIISRGDNKFQNIKIEKSGALEHVDGVFIVQDGDKDVLDIDLLVDDSKKELDRVDVETFHFNRNEQSIEDILDRVKDLV